MKRIILFVFLCTAKFLYAQNEDSLDNVRLAQMIQLSEVVVRNKLDINSFIERVKNDSSFYKAFRNLRVLSYTSLNDIRMLDKKGKVKASMQSRTRQQASAGCRSMEVLEEKSSGDFYEKDSSYQYYTAELYASLFFTKGKICGETNIVKGHERNVKSKKGIEKHKEQMKMLFFDPGKKIPGIPLMGDKTAIFDRDNAGKYSYAIDFVDYNGQSCYLFTLKPKRAAAW
jgi:hypothetical protein